MIRQSIVGAMGVFLLMSAPALAGVGDKVTGGADTITANGIEFSMTVNAVQTPNGLKGHIEYTRESSPGVVALGVHVDAACLAIGGTTAYISGPAMVQANTIAFPTNDWFEAAIEEGGTGSGDAVRARFVEAGHDCAADVGGNIFPGEVIEGEFKIRQGQ